MIKYHMQRSIGYTQIPFVNFLSLREGGGDVFPLTTISDLLNGCTYLKYEANPINKNSYGMSNLSNFNIINWI